MIEKQSQVAWTSNSRWKALLNCLIVWNQPLQVAELPKLRGSFKSMSSTSHMPSTGVQVNPCADYNDAFLGRWKHMTGSRHATRTLFTPLGSILAKHPHITLWRGTVKSNYDWPQHDSPGEWAIPILLLEQIFETALDPLLAVCGMWVADTVRFTEQLLGLFQTSDSLLGVAGRKRVSSHRSSCELPIEGNYAPVQAFVLVCWSM